MLEERHYQTVKLACAALDDNKVVPPRVLYNEDPGLRNEPFFANSFMELFELSKRHPVAGDPIAHMITEIAAFKGIGKDLYSLFVHDKGTIKISNDGTLAYYKEGANMVGFNFNRYTMDNKNGGFDMSGLEIYPFNSFSHELAHHLDWDKAQQRWLHSSSKLFHDITDVDYALKGDQSLFSHVEDITSRLYKIYTHGVANLLEPFANTLAIFSVAEQVHTPSILENYRDTILATQIHIRTRLSGATLQNANETLEKAVEEGLPDSILRKLAIYSKLKAATTSSDAGSLPIKLRTEEIQRMASEITQECTTHMQNITSAINHQYGLKDSNVHQAEQRAAAPSVSGNFL